MASMASFRDARAYDYEFEHHEIDGIKFKTTILDTDYIGCGYDFPNNNDKVVVYTGGYSNWEDSNNIDSKDYRICILNWNNFYENPEFFGYYINLMVFDNSVDNMDIVKTFQKFIDRVNEQRKNTFNFAQTMKKSFKISDNLYFDEIIVFNTNTMKIENKLLMENTVDKDNEFSDPTIFQDGDVQIISANNETIKLMSLPEDISSKNIVVINKFVKPIKHFHNTDYKIRKHVTDWAIYKIYKWDDFQMEYVPDFKEFGYYDVNKLHDPEDIGIINFSKIIVFPKNWDNSHIHENVKNYIWNEYRDIPEIHEYIRNIKGDYSYDITLDYSKGILFHPEFTELMNYRRPN